MTSINTALFTTLASYNSATFNVNKYGAQLASGQQFQPGDPGFSISLTPEGENAARSGVDQTLSDELGVFTQASSNVSLIQSDFTTLINDATALASGTLDSKTRDATITDFENTLTHAESLTGASSPLYANPFDSNSVSVVASVNGGQLQLTGAKPIEDALAAIDAEINNKPGNGHGNGFGSHTIDLKKSGDAATLLNELTNTFKPQIDIAASGITSDVTALQGSIVQNQATETAAKSGENAQFGVNVATTTALFTEAQSQQQRALGVVNALLGDEVAVETSLSQMLQNTTAAIQASSYAKTQSLIFPPATTFNQFA